MLLLDTFEVLEPQILTGGGIEDDINCVGETNGSLDLSITGGTTPYVINWNTGENTSSISELAEGTYTVSIVDGNGCSTIENYEIIEPDSLSIETNIQVVGCKTDDDGFIDVTTFGGTAPYTFSWDNGSTTEDNFDLSANNYNLTVTDVNGCITSIAAAQGRLMHPFYDQN